MTKFYTLPPYSSFLISDKEAIARRLQKEQAVVSVLPKKQLALDAASKIQGRT